MHRRNWLTLGSSVALLVVVFVLSLQLERVSNGVELPDGTSFTLLGVTFGTNHELKTGPNWDKLFGWCPWQIREYLPRGTNLMMSKTHSEELAIWYGLAISHESETRYELASPCEIYVQGEDGILCETIHYKTYFDEASFLFSSFSDAKRPHSSAFSPGKSLNMFRGSQVFSRRSKDLEIRILDSDNPNAKPVHTFKIRNPAYGKTRSLNWPEKPLPQREKAGDVDITLKSLRTVPSVGTSMGNQIVLEIVGNGQETWAASLGKIEDSTGNQIVPFLESCKYATNEVCILFRGAPMPNEVWRLEFALHRKSGFKPEELLQFNAVSLPKTGNELIYSHSVSSKGSSVSLIKIANDGWRIKLIAQLSVDGKARLQSAKDGEGRVLPHYTGFHSFNIHEYYIDLQNPETPSLDLTFVVPEIRTVTFYAKPEIVNDISNFTNPN